MRQLDQTKRAKKIQCAKIEEILRELDEKL